jgi:4-amino-4-deoxy-L-arabinose transferase-like glycosyltransferase
VSEAHNPIPDLTSLSTAAKIGWTLLILATLYVCYFSHLGALGFIGPDEPRYAWIARDMAETGDWVTPRLYGKPWFEKPPLYYWGAALSFKLFGVSETTARLPSAVSALLATLALAWLAWRLYGAETARWLLLLLPTTVGMIGFSHAAATDMPFSASLTIAMVCAAFVLRLVPPRYSVVGTELAPPAATTRNSNNSTAPRSFTSFTSSTSFASFFFGFFLGLAVLAKGPAAIILCGGAVFFWALFTKRWRDAFRLLHPAAIAAFCLTALPWYILCTRRNPDFFLIFIIEHNFKRYLTPEFHHIQPWWFYVPILLIAMLPWTSLVLWSALIGTLRLLRLKRVSADSAYFALWTLFCLLFFSLSQSKLPGYILPAIPAIGTIIANSHAVLNPAHLRWFRFTQWSAAIAFLGLCLMLEAFAKPMYQPSQRSAVPAGAIIGLLGAANLILAIFYPSGPANAFRRLPAGLCVLPILLALPLTFVFLSEYFRWDPSGKSIARELQLHRIPGEKLYVLGMSPGQHYSLNFYLHKDIPDWDSDHPAEGYVLTRSRAEKPVNQPAWSCEEMAFDLQATGRFLYRVGPKNSVKAASGSGQLQ